MVFVTNTMAETIGTDMFLMSELLAVEICVDHNLDTTRVVTRGTAHLIYSFRGAGCRVRTAQTVEHDTIMVVVSDGAGRPKCDAIFSLSTPVEAISAWVGAVLR